MKVSKKFTLSLGPFIFLFFSLSGQNVQYSISAESFAPLAGQSSSSSYSQFSAVEPFGGLSVKNLPDFKNFVGLVGQLPPPWIRIETVFPIVMKWHWERIKPKPIPMGTVLPTGKKRLLVPTRSLPTPTGTAILITQK